MTCEIQIPGTKCTVPEGKCPLFVLGPKLAALGNIERSKQFLNQKYSKCSQIKTATQLLETTATKLSTNELPITIDGDTIANV